jgi:hypothetical protein
MAMCGSNEINEMLKVTGQVLIRCFAMGMALLFLWMGWLVLGGDILYWGHSQFIQISREQLEAIHYGGMLLTKAAIFILFLMPYLSIRIVLGKRKKLARDTSR